MVCVRRPMVTAYNIVYIEYRVYAHPKQESPPPHTHTRLPLPHRRKWIKSWWRRCGTERAWQWSKSKSFFLRILGDAIIIAGWEQWCWNRNIKKRTSKNWRRGKRAKVVRKPHKIKFYIDIYIHIKLYSYFLTSPPPKKKTISTH